MTAPGAPLCIYTVPVMYACALHTAEEGEGGEGEGGEGEGEVGVEEGERREEEGGVEEEEWGLKAGGMGEREEGMEEQGGWVVVVGGVGREQWEMALTEKFGGL